MATEKVLLIILDGFGEGKNYQGNAITLAHAPTLAHIKKEYPHTILKASGQAVGIPEGTQGGSEVGHFTMGAGRVVFQSLDEINESITDGSFSKKTALLDAVKHVKKSEKSALHLIGMISDQGVHAHINHLFALLEFAKQQECYPIYIHAITDGRDVPERSAKKFIQQILDKIHELQLDQPMFENGPQKAKIATIIGRYYAMDRDSNWNRTQIAYDLYTLGKGIPEKNPLDAIQHAYDRGIETDYYIDAIKIHQNEKIESSGRGQSPSAQRVEESGSAGSETNELKIKDKDAVIFWNFRTDRARQITWCFTREAAQKTEGLIAPPKGLLTNPPLEKRTTPFFVCFGDYSKKAPVLFPTPVIKNNLGQIIEQKNLKQFRIAETEKYAHVTYFFNSQIEKPFAHEERLLINSEKCPSYAEKPEMSAGKITDALLKNLDKGYALIVLNYANCDLVGHSGDLNAAIKAVEVIDECLNRIIPEALKNNFHIFITGDHGNIEYMIYDEGDKKGEPCPSHTTNPVPLFLISKKFQHAELQKNGELQDIAPTILDIMQIEKPQEMTGRSLLRTEQNEVRLSNNT